MDLIDMQRINIDDFWFLHSVMGRKRGGEVGGQLTKTEDSMICLFPLLVKETCAGVRIRT